LAFFFILTMNEPGEGYSRKESCGQNFMLCKFI